MLLSLPAFAQEAPRPADSSGRFLLLVDTSLAMRRRAEGTRQAIETLLVSDLGGRLRPGDTIGLWTFNEDVSAGRFPLQQWSPATRRAVTDNVLEFLRGQRYEKRTDLDAALAQAFPLVQQSQALTLVLFTGGDAPVRGTPFDEAIAAAFAELRGEQRRVRLPLVTVLRAEGGRFVNHVVGQPQWPLAIPLLPGEQPALQAKTTQPPKPAKEDVRAALEKANASPVATATKPKPPPAAMAKAEPAPAPAPPPTVAPAPPKASPQPDAGNVVAEASPTLAAAAPRKPPVAEKPPAPPPVPEPPKPAEVKAAPPVETKPAVAAPAQPPPVVSEPTPKPKPVRAVEAAPADVMRAPAEEPKPPAVETKPAAARARPAAEVAVSPPVAPLPVQAAAAVRPPPFLSGHRLLVLGLLLLAVAGVLLFLITRRARVTTPHASLITQSFDRDKIETGPDPKPPR